MRRSAVLLVLLLAACGQSGDLYLPGEPPPPPPATVPGTSSSSPLAPEPEKKDQDD